MCFVPDEGGWGSESWARVGGRDPIDPDPEGVGVGGGLR